MIGNIGILERVKKYNRYNKFITLLWTASYLISGVIFFQLLTTTILKSIGIISLCYFVFSFLVMIILGTINALSFAVPFAWINQDYKIIKHSKLGEFMALKEDDSIRIYDMHIRNGKEYIGHSSMHDDIKKTKENLNKILEDKYQTHLRKLKTQEKHAKKNSEYDKWDGTLTTQQERKGKLIDILEDEISKKVNEIN